MTETTFEELKAKVDELKTKRDQALGAIKSIEDRWERNYGTRDVNVMKEKFSQMQKELAELNSDYYSTLEKAEEILAGVK